MQLLPMLSPFSPYCTLLSFQTSSVKEEKNSNDNKDIFKQTKKPSDVSHHCKKTGTCLNKTSYR